MILNNHSKLKDKHAFLSASKYSWVNYDKERLRKNWESSLAKAKGSQLHNLAEMLITHGIVQIDNGSTFNQYVNDAIGYRMKPEAVLYYSDNCFGTADAILLSKGLLRIHDLKTGTSPAKMTQLLIYAAMYCLEYAQDPFKISYELRIYQNNEIKKYCPDGVEIRWYMDKIIEMDKEVDQLKLEML